MKSIKRVLGTSCAVFLVGCLVSGLVFSATNTDVERWEKEKAVAPLIMALGDKFIPVQRGAAEALGRIGDARAVEPLIRALGNFDSCVCDNAAEALGKIGQPAVEPLIKALGGKNSYVRCNAAKTLGKIGDKRAVEPLIMILSDSSHNVRWSAAEALGNMGDDRAVEPLIMILGGVDWEVINIAAKALGKIGDTRAVEPLIAELRRNESDIIHGTVAEALGKIGDDRAVEPLISTLQSKYSDTRKNAAEALGKIGDAKAVEPLIVKLIDENVDVRNYVIEALGKIGSIKAVDGLIAALRNKYSDVRKNAVDVLGKIEQNWHDSDAARKQVPKLFAALLDPSVRKDAADTLNRIFPTIKSYTSIFKATLKLPFHIPILWNILQISLTIGLLVFINRSKLRIYGIFPVFIFWYSCFLFIEILFIVFTSLVKVNLYCLLLPLPFVYNTPVVVFLFMPFVNGKWLRAKRQAKHFVCSRDYHRRFTLGPGLPWIVRWSRRILFIEKPKQHDDFEDYFVCKTCEKNDSRLINVRKVIGLIGGDVGNHRHDGEIFYVSLWNEAEKKATNADIDVLEIHESNGISYDYAVNAVLNVLKNDVSRPRNYVKGIPVIIRGIPPLSENSRMILQHEFGGIRRG